MNLLVEEKQCILRFLYNVADADKKILPGELEVIHKAAKLLKIDFKESDEWLISKEKVNDEVLFNSIIGQYPEKLGIIIQWSTEIMNSDHLKHQNEQLLILNLIKTSLGNPEYPNAELVGVKELDDVIVNMIKSTPKLCHAKADHWQKSKPGKPLKRVAASISFITNGKKQFVTAVNYELSTPGGSRCAEQNAIGMIIAQHPEIEKKDIKEVVVYGGDGLSNPCWPCGICTENLDKINIEKQITLYVYPKNYKYSQGDLPKEMIKTIFTDFVHR